MTNLKTRKRKKDSGDEVSRLERQVRELKSINRNLTKRLKKLEKGKDRYEEYEEDCQEEALEDKRQEPPTGNLCTECKTGQIELIDLGARKMEKCLDCGHRKTKKS